MATLLERLDALLSEVEESIQVQFREFIRQMNSDSVLGRILEILEQGRIDDALDIVDSFIERFADILPKVQQTVGTKTAEELAESVGDIAVGIGFNPAHPRAAAIASASRLALITEMIPEQRKAIRQAISRGLDEGKGTAAIARQFRGAIGLTTEQEKWVQSYENRLRALDRKALTMNLRNRQHDEQVKRAIRDGRPLTEKQIETMVERYRLRALMYRSDTIARTEALRSTSLAREEALQQMMEQTGISPERIRRIWNSAQDRRVRDAHEVMQGDEVGVGEKFTDGDGNELMWPGDPAAPADTTINCRCAVTFRILPPQ